MMRLVAIGRLIKSSEIFTMRHRHDAQTLASSHHRRALHGDV